MTNHHDLYLKANQADQTLNDVLRTHTGRSRWAMRVEDYKIPEVRIALRAKLDADEEWLKFLRTAHLQRG